MKDSNDIASLGLAPRAEHALRRAGVFLISDLKNLTLADVAGKRFRGLGRKMAKEIEEAMTYYGGLRRPAPGHFLEPEASVLEAERSFQRNKGKRLVFDCFNAKTDGTFVKCSEGKELTLKRNDGAIPILDALKGSAPTACQECEFYDE